MSSVYRIDDDGATEPFDKVHCTDESEELQRVLEMNLDLCLMIKSVQTTLVAGCWKREMPVQDPVSGGVR